MQAIGVLSGKVYVQGKTKAELCRFLNGQYPSYRDSSRHRKTLRHQILPEPLKLVTDNSNR